MNKFIKKFFIPSFIIISVLTSSFKAEKNVLSRLALKALSEQEHINVIDSEIDLKMSEFESEIKNSPKQIDVTQLREAIRSDLIKDKVIQWLEENSQVIEKAETNLKNSSKKLKKTSINKSQKNSTKATKKKTKAKEKT